MKIRVISEFYDKYHTSTLFKVGAVLDFDEERAKDVIAKKLAEPFEEPEDKKRPGRPPKDVKPEPVKAKETTEVKATEEPKSEKEEK